MSYDGHFYSNHYIRFVLITTFIPLQCFVMKLRAQEFSAYMSSTMEYFWLTHHFVVMKYPFLLLSLTLSLLYNLSDMRMVMLACFIFPIA